MDPKAITREIKRQAPEPPRYRAAKGRWVKPAWVVRRMVENEKWSVTDAVNEVIHRMKLQPKFVAFGGIRAAYYVVRKKDWKEEPK